MTTASIANAEKFIEEAYAKLATAVPNFEVRADQVTLSKAIARDFINKVPLAAEAATGTGKTIAYLIGQLAASREMKSNNGQKPIVVSTGTKALQSQLIISDLPKLAAAGLIAPDSAVIAKGRGNYFCLHAADELVSQEEMAFEVDELEEEEIDSPMLKRLSADEVQPLYDAYKDKSWDGDFDNYAGILPKPLDSIRVSRDTCTGRKCPRYSQCAFYRMKQRMANASVIVANHDLTLLDLLLVSEGIESTLPVESYLVVFDEAHQLPDKALKLGSSEANLGALRSALERLKHFRKTVWSSVDLINLMAAKSVYQSFFEVNDALATVDDLMQALEYIQVDKETNIRRFPKGHVPDKLVVLIEEACKQIQPIQVKLTQAVSAIQEHGQAEGNAGRKDIADSLYFGVMSVKAIESAMKGLTSFKDGKDVVKWLYLTDQYTVLHTSPLEGAEVLKPLLWNAERAQAVMVSATLQDLNGFDRFKVKAGLPETANTMVMPYTFPYHESTLTVAHMKATPKPAERKAFIAELSEKLPQYFDKNEATLVLFPSRTLMKALTPVLKDKLGEATVLVQGERPVKQLIATHMARVDAGRPSMLCGLATMAEGLDLPGDYCRHVMILALPFAVPADPVEQEIAELLGSRYFSERSLPDAAVRLTQAVGRLLRRESDRGRITVFDTRLASTGYGRKMLAYLPPFTKVVEKPKAVA